MGKKKSKTSGKELVLAKSKILEIATENKREIVVTISNRMKKLEITRYSLSKMTGVSESTISRFFNLESDLTLVNFFKICEALEINPYIIAKENDTKELQELNLLHEEYFKRTYYNQ